MELGQDDLTWPGSRLTVIRWWWWSDILIPVCPSVSQCTAVCQCVSDIITSHLPALCMLMSWLITQWCYGLCEGRGGRERERCDVGETVNTSPEHRDHSNIRRSVLQLPGEQAMGRYWLDYWEDIPVIIRLSFTHLLNTSLRVSSHLQENPVPANNFSHETYWTGENPSRQICLYNFYDRLKPNWVEIFWWGVRSQHTWLVSDSIRIGIIQGSGSQVSTLL